MSTKMPVIKMKQDSLLHFIDSMIPASSGAGSIVAVQRHMNTHNTVAQPQHWNTSVLGKRQRDPEGRRCSQLVLLILKTRKL